MKLEKRISDLENARTAGQDGNWFEEFRAHGRAILREVMERDGIKQLEVPPNLTSIERLRYIIEHSKND